VKGVREMIISRKADYGLRIVLELSKIPPGTTLSAKELATRQGIPSPFLAKIVAQLASNHILETKRGLKGGIKLSAPPECISVLDVIEAVDGCVGICYCSVRSVECPRRNYCSIRRNLNPIEEKIKSELKSITIATLAQEELRALEEA
jgi:Rrf2 family protein